MIYTSYFANAKNFPKDALIYSVALKRISNIERMDIFMPDYMMMKNLKSGLITKHGFKSLYITKLKNAWGIEEICNKLKNEAKDVVLCCFEKSEDFCHRHILSSFLNKNYEMNIREL